MSIIYKIGVDSTPDRPILSMIYDGLKLVEGRKYDRKYLFNVGDIIYFIPNDLENCDLKFVKCRVSYMHYYISIKEYLDNEGFKSAIPWVDTYEEAYKLYTERWYPDLDTKKLNDEHGYCFIGIGVEPIITADIGIEVEYE